eukprot:gene15877-21527_t
MIKVESYCPITSLAIVGNVSSDSENNNLLLFYNSSNSLLFENIIENDNSISKLKIDCKKNVIYSFPSNTIHGIRHYHSREETLKPINYILCFGGKSLVVVDVCSLFYTVSPVVCELLELDDLVIEASIKFVENSSNLVLIIGYAHNFIDIYSFSHSSNKSSKLDSTVSFHKRIICPSQEGVLFTMSVAFSPATNSNDIFITSGTVFGNVILWKVQLTFQENIDHSVIPLFIATTHHIYTIDAHEGVMFRLVWSQNLTKLLSVADDRTLRYFDLTLLMSSDPLDQKDNNAFVEELFVGWGHISRIWDVLFVGKDDCEIATCSEDSTIKIWTFSGTCICTMRGHDHHIWRLTKSFDGLLLISSGNDSSIKLWDISYQKLTSPSNLLSSVNVINIPCLPIVENRTNERIDLNMPRIHNSSNNRRANGVCVVKLAPCGNWMSIILIDGGLWLVKLNNNNVFDSTSCKWSFLHHLQKPITAADVLFEYDNNDIIKITIISAHSNCENTFIQINWNPTYHSNDHEMSNSIIDSFIIEWKAHNTRTVNLWLLQSQSDEGMTANNPCILTSTINGHCALWCIDTKSSLTNKHLLQLEESSSHLGIRIISRMVTGRGEIATCSVLVKNQVNSNSHNSIRKNDDYIDLLGMDLLIGDLRGGISFYFLTHAFLCSINQTTENVDNERVKLADSYLYRIHGSEPVSCMIETREGFISCGHDGFLCVFNFVTHNNSNDNIHSDNNNKNCDFMDISNDWKIVNKYHSPMHKEWVLMNKLTCLPITTPDQVFADYKSDPFSHSTTIQSLYVAGYHGNEYIIWDIFNGYQIMRVEGGGWKRPHNTSLTITNKLNNYCSLPSVKFICAVPQNNNNKSKGSSVLHCFGAKPTELLLPSHGKGGDDNHTKQLTIAMLPLHLQVPSLGRVGYCCSFLRSHVSHAVDQYVMTGGEDGIIKVFHIPSFKFKQEIHLPDNACIKAMKTVSMATESDPNRVLFIVGGGKLSYQCYLYDQHTSKMTEMIDENGESSSFSCVFHQIHESAIRHNVSQDHRILSIDCIPSLHSNNNNNINNNDWLGLIILCDSRGYATIVRIEVLINPTPLYSLNSDLIVATPDRFVRSDLKINTSILQELCVSSFPLLCCNVLYVADSSDILVTYGDTSGFVHVWIINSNKINHENTSFHHIGSFQAHLMGVNTMSITHIPTPNIQNININNNNNNNNNNKGFCVM